MSKKINNQDGFSVIETSLVIVIITLMTFIGFKVINNNKTATTKYDSATVQESADEISNKIQTSSLEESEISNSKTPLEDSSTSSGDTTPGTSSSAQTSEATTSTSNLATFTSKYNGLTFTYDKSWRSIIYSNDSSSAGATVVSTNNTISLSYGTPVVKPSNTTCKPSNDTLYIYEVIDGPTLKDANKLYIIKYSIGASKYVALTDWNGKKPTVGKSDKCSDYLPAFLDTKTKYYSWFRISYTSESYEALSATDFYNKSDVKSAIDSIKSTKL